MDDIIKMLHSGNANVKVEVSGEDLLTFSNELINRAKTELSVEFAESCKEKYLIKEEVKEICNVCDATLWHWNRKTYGAENVVSAVLRLDEMTPHIHATFIPIVTTEHKILQSPTCNP